MRHSGKHHVCYNCTISPQSRMQRETTVMFAVKTCTLYTVERTVFSVKDVGSIT